MDLTKDQVKQRIIEEIDNSKEQIINFAKDIAETGYREIQTAKKVREIFSRLSLGFTDEHAITGVKASPISGRSPGPTIAVIGELDGLIVKDHPLADKVTNAVHACGHNCQLGSMFGVGLELINAQANQYFNGNVVLFAVPAEETIENQSRIGLIDSGKLGFISGKQELVRQGSFDDIDLAMLSDATSVLSDKDLAVGGSSLGHMVKYVEFHGVAAHAASAPQDGVNALKAVNIAMIAKDSRCESFEDEDKVRVHGILTEGGTSVNSIPSIAKLEWRVRGKTIHVVDKINKKIDRSIKAGALAMGAKVRIRSIAGNLPMLQDNFMNDLYLENARSVVGERNVVIHPADQTFGSTDMGDLSQIIPIIHPRIGGAIGNGHGNNFYITDYEKSVFNPAKAMAMTIVDLLWHEDSKSNEILENHKPVFTRSEYVNMQNERMGNEFYDYS